MSPIVCLAITLLCLAIVLMIWPELDRSALWADHRVYKITAVEVSES